MDQFCCKLGQSLDPPACKSIFDVDVLPLDVTKITQPLTEGVDFRRGSGRAVMQEPIRGTFAGCCACAASGHAAAAPPSSVMNSRRLTRSPHPRGRAAMAEFSMPSALAVLRLTT